MKTFLKVLCMVLFFTIFAISKVLAEETNPCDRVLAITDTGFVQSFTNYRPARTQGDFYCLVYTGTPHPTGISFTIDVAALLGERIQNVYISGLNMEATDIFDTPFLTITNNTTNRVIVTGLQMTNVKNGLKLMDSGPIEVRDSQITGVGGDFAARTGACVEVQSAGAVVKSSEILDCNEGIKIAASNVFLGASDAAAYDEDKNTLTANTIGIHQINGSGNRWPFNSISGGRGIVVEGGTRPVLRVGEGDIATLECEQTEGEASVSSCAMQFVSLPEAAGEVEIYKTDRPPPAELQGRDYIAQCNVGEENTCAFNASNATNLISQIDCGLEKCNFTAVFTNESSSMYVNPFKVEKNISTILMPTTEMPIGGTAGLDGGTETDGGGNHELYIDGTDSGNILGTEQRGGGTGGQQKTVGVSISPKACKFASANNARAKGIFEMWWWLIFTLPLPYFMRRREKYR